MQSPLFAHADNQVQERYSLQNPQLLRVALQGREDVLARKGSMVAYQGMIEFDAEYQSSNERRNRRSTGEGLDLMRCHGQGTLYLANLAQYIHLVDVDQDGLTVDSGYVLALDSSLNVQVVAVDSQYGISGTGKYQLTITGRGKVALMTSGEPLMLRVGQASTSVNVDSDAIVAWSAGLRVQMQAQTQSSSALRRRGNTGEGWELGFQGEGYVLVQPSELLPPQNARTGGGVAAQYGMGGRGAHGQNRDNAWN
ncbi:AIM24 family protein [Streptomyces uncialis]|uniref:AIM24 family protein n=1 Tax=Streptomyces uncialis TaxID=1048205 RepID=UPI002E3011FE|nr:AIM24 family protein [Streptomyces uncialis]